LFDVNENDEESSNKEILVTDYHSRNNSKIRISHSVMHLYKTPINHTIETEISESEDDNIDNHEFKINPFEVAISDLIL